MPEALNEHLVDMDNIAANKSGNRPFSDVLEVNASRRTLLKGSLAVAAIAFFGGSVGS